MSDANLRGSWLNNVAARVNTEAFDDLDAPVVLGAPELDCSSCWDGVGVFRHSGRHPRRDPYAGAAACRSPDPGGAGRAGYARGVEVGYLIGDFVVAFQRTLGIPVRRPLVDDQRR
ncbi:MAG TPA: hypothetical protein VHR39_14600 [Propionibacteriaceae bacterium]|nr:hypothetical protein [Propionibacteriaceae bacterium]